MDIINKAILFDGQAEVSILDTSEIAREAVSLHNLNLSTTQVLAKTLTIAAFIASSFKNEGNRLTIIIKGNGPIEKVVTCADYGCKVKGYCTLKVPQESLNTCDTRELIGRGELRILMDMGLKEPYNGIIELVDGSIAADFMYYYQTSQQLNTLICLDVKEIEGKIISGGLVIQALPGCGENELFVLSDIARNFKNFANLLNKYTPKEIIDMNFGHFQIEYLDEIRPSYHCACSFNAIKNAIISMGKEEAFKIIDEYGKLEVECAFCKSISKFTKKDLMEIFSNDKEITNS